MKKMKVILISILVVVTISVIAGFFIVQSMEQRAEAAYKAMNQMVLVDVDLSKVPDGEYEGNYESFPIIVKVKVSVINHTITDIRLLEHRSGQGQDADKILSKIIEAQSIKVDTISGATYSSKVIQKAVELALLSSFK